MIDIGPLNPIASILMATGLRIRNATPTGRVIYVCSIGGTNRASSFGNGSSPDAPLASVGGTNGALAKLAAPTARTFKGDVIVCLPGHVESVSSADYFSDTGTASDITILGLGSGTHRPTFNWTAAASTWLMDTVGMEIVNCVLNFAVTAATVVVTPITVSAGSCRIANCFINWGASTTIGCGSTLGAIAVVGAREFVFENNTCVNLDVAGTTGQAITLLSLNGADYAVIRNNKVTGATTVTTVGVIHCVTTLSKNITVANNELENLIASSTVTMSSAIAGVTGKSYNNFSRVNSGILAETASSNWSVTSYNNYTADTVNLSGALDLAGGASS